MYDVTVIAEDIWETFGNPKHPKVNIFQYAPELLNHKTKRQCCLGFEAEQCGVPREDLTYVTSPHGIGKSQQNKIVHLVTKSMTGSYSSQVSTRFSEDAMSINDHSTMKYADKKRKLKALWKAQGWRLIFVQTVDEMKQLVKKFNNTKHQEETC